MTTATKNFHDRAEASTYSPTLEEAKRGAQQGWDDVKIGVRHAADEMTGVVTDISNSVSTHLTGQPSYAVPERVAASFSVDKLQECLRGELSAVEAYKLALDSTKSEAAVLESLRDLRDMHERRVASITNRIIRCGAQPAESSGAWGAFASVVQRGADLLGDTSALSMLEEGEDHGLALYASDLDACDAQTRVFILAELLPDQQRSHDLCRSLYRFVKAT